MAEALLNDRFELISIQELKGGEELTMGYNKCVDDPMCYDTLCEQNDVSVPFLEF
jgi:hypothetical protein